MAWSDVLGCGGMGLGLAGSGCGGLSVIGAVGGGAGAAASVFGQEGVGVGAVGAEGQGFPGETDPALFVGLLVRMEQDFVGLVQRGALAGITWQPGDKRRHHPFRRPAVGDVSGRLGAAALRPLPIRLSSLPGHRTVLRAVVGSF
jgi:hypothetical protein